MTFVLDGFNTDAFVTATLAEDLGEGGDVTSAAVYQTAGRVASRQEVDELYDPENDNRRRRA